MTSFHEVQFPLPLAFGATGGPQRQTEITQLSNGFEQRNTSQAHSRRRYDAGVGVKTINDVQKLIAFFEARRGQLYGFRFRDPVDFSTAIFDADISPTDQQIGIGDGQTTQYQLVKTYGEDAYVWQRIIYKPVEGSLRIALNGIEETGFSADPITGIVIFDTPPTVGSVITAGFVFDVPVRFDTDHLNTSLESFGAGSALNIPLVEIRI